MGLLRFSLTIILAVFFLSVAAAPARASGGPAPDESKAYYIFAFFRHGEKTYVQDKQFFSGGAGVYFAWSEDGLAWSEIGPKKLFFKPKLGNTLRDPTIVRGPGGTFHLVWTTGWRDRTIGYASSPDLLHWENERLLPVMKHEPGALNAWAPEIVFDPPEENFLIFWSSTITGRFPESWEPDEGYNHRFYFTATKDFRKFTRPALLFDPGFNCIDATMLADGGKYLMFFKNETLHPPAKYIVLAESENAEGPFGNVSPRISPENVWAEGPSALKIGDTYYVYYDMFREDRYGAVSSTDLKTWTDAGGRLSMPAGAKHGSFIKVSREELDRLLAAAGEK